MAPLYGRLKGEDHRKVLTRRGFYGVESWLETWDGGIHTVLLRDGTARVYVGEKNNPSNLVWEGNVEAGVTASRYETRRKAERAG